MRKLLFILFTIGLSLPSMAQVVWTNNGDGVTWSDPLNWNPGVPGSLSAVSISTQPLVDIIAIDVSSTAVASFTFSNLLTAGVTIQDAGGGETLQVNGAISNQSSFGATFALPVFSGASSTWTGPLQFGNSVSLATNQITLANAITLSGSNLNFDITNASTYGRFLGAGTATVTGVTINIGGAYTGVANDTFDFTSGSFSGATLNVAGLPALTGGLTWDSSNFLTNGTLTVVPEPSTWALFATGLAAAVAFRSRRRRS